MVVLTIPRVCWPFRQSMQTHSAASSGDIHFPTPPRLHMQRRFVDQRQIRNWANAPPDAANAIEISPDSSPRTAWEFRTICSLAALSLSTGGTALFQCAAILRPSQPPMAANAAPGCATARSVKMNLSTLPVVRGRTLGTVTGSGSRSDFCHSWNFRTTRSPITIDHTRPAAQLKITRQIGN